MAALIVLSVAVTIPFAQAAPPTTSVAEAPVLGWMVQQPPSSEAGEAVAVQPPDSDVEWETLPPDIQAKVDPRILAELRGEVIPAHLSSGPDQADVAPAERKPLEKTRFLVYLEAKANLSTIAQQRFATRVERRAAVFDTLVSTAQATQGPVKALLGAQMSRGDVASYQPFYIFNGFAVEGGLDTIIKMAQRDDVERIVANYPLVPLWDSGKAAGSPASDLGSLHSDNWNIDLVDAERVWSEFGITGEGAVVAGIDTGVDWTHPALQSQYRGYSPSGFDHNYNWFDPDPNLYAGGDLGPSRSTAPFDFGAHGTHTMGTMVGDGGTPGTQVGMAPGAKWVAISMNELGVAGSVADDIMGNKAFQWMMCPTDLSGALATADCSKAPDVVNNSWGSANPADDTFRPAIQALRAAGVAPVFASGNPSASAGSIGAPGNAPEAITVGATDVDDNVASFSGRGPSFYEGEQKPELSAPGVNVNSTVPGGGYSGPTWSGTSMAAPHVAGLIALMVSADLQDGYRDFNVDELERFMEYTAVDLGDPGPDDDYGYGRIDAYNGVRWVRSAGDLRGTVTDAGTSASIEGAAVTGANPGDVFTTETGASGQYSTTVPAGIYDVIVEAWGYYSDTFPGQTVITGALSIADFSLVAMPAATLTGKVLSGTTPISGALVYVDASPAVHYVTGADGAYTLILPVGTHGLVVEATGYRVLREDVRVASAGSTHDFSMTPAPTILLVDADAYAGWFVGWPVHGFFQWGLDQENYLYDLWKVQYTTFDDTQVMPDGSLGYGIPSITTLDSYDLVMWAHGGGGWGTTGSTVNMGADDELMDYLDNGGWLIISGQDLGYEDDGMTFYDDYLHADHVMDAAAGEGETVSGQGFLAGLNLEITNASLHGYANGMTDLSPDAVVPEDGAALPVLTYDNGNGIAALAVAPCDASYRAVYFTLGYENIGPRTGSRAPAIAEVLDRSIGWVMGTKPTYGVSVSTTPSRQVGEGGDTVTYDCQIVNTGSGTAAFELSLAGNVWPTRMLSGTTEVTLVPGMPPCSLQELTLEVDIPATADTGDQDIVTVTASRYPAGTPSASADVTTVASPQWQVETPMPTPRYRLAAASLPGDIYYYAIGGNVTGANERYNACTGRWEVMAPMPTARGNIGAAVIDGKIYVPGGCVGGGTYVDVLEIYDPATDSWSTGASLPEALSGGAVAAYSGRLYVFGGSDTGGGYSAKTYEYDPVTDTWTEKANMPGGGRAYAVAAALDDKIYVAGGWANLRTVEVYDPATDSWFTAASMNVGRQSPGLTAAPDGYLYVSGGGDGWWGLNSAERYDPTSDTWEMISSLNDGDRAGSASAYTAGRIFAVGSSKVNESLRLSDAFCDSGKSVLQSMVQPGERITYTVEIHSDPVDLTSASLVDPIPAGTTFAGFGVNLVGATYNSTDDRVEWSGDIPAQADPLAFTFGVDVAAGGWTDGDRIANTVTFDSGAGLVFTHAVASVVGVPDASPSVKWVDKSQALAGDVLTYTIRVENGSVISDAFTLRDPIPANATYIPGSLTYTSGTGGYDPVNDVITWTGTLPAPGTYVNTSSDYEWGDSDGNGVVPGVAYNWIDISGTGTSAGTGDDSYYCGLPIGFTFNFYGTAETTFCASTNGFVSFDISGYSDLSNDCPLPSTDGSAALTAGIWDDLVTEGGIYYQTFGTAPNRYLVVQWVGVRYFGGSTYFGFEIILYENGAIKVQMLDVGPEMGSGSTTGIEDYAETQGLTYACNAAGSIHNELAVGFLPDGATWSGMIPSADVTFAVITTAPLLANTWITNTAAVANPYGSVERSAGTLVNPVDLSTSTKKADRTQATVGEVVRYDFILENTGLLAATGATLTDPIPANTTYVPGSLTYTLGTGGYDPVNDVITWTGSLLYVNTSDDYEWGDSDGNGAVPGVTFNWVDISATGTPVFLGDNDYAGPFGVGFTFDFYGTKWTDTYINSNGLLSFGAGWSGAHTNDCIPNTNSPNNIIALMWDDLDPGDTNDPAYYESFASCPIGSGACLVVQYENYYHYPGGGSIAGTFEAILYDDGTILLQFLDAGAEEGSGSTTGIEDGTGTSGVNYACNAPGSLHDNLAVLFLPPGGATDLSAGVAFAVTLTTPLPDRTPVTNMASLNDGYGNLYDLEAVFLARNSDLSASFKQVHPTQGRPGDTVTYTVYVHNAGAVATTGEVGDELPPELTYETGSLLCGTGSCGEASGVITWTGMVAPRSMVPVRFRATVPAGAAQGDLIVNTATVTDTVWNTGYQVLAPVTVVGYGVMVAPSADVQSGDPGTTVTYTLQVTNAGNTTDMFSVTVGGNTWDTAADPTTVGPLAAGESANVVVTVNIPTSAVGGDTDSATITITSRGDPTKSVSVTLTTLTMAEIPVGWDIYLPLIARNG